MRKINIDAELLIFLYHECKLSTYKIANLLRTNQTTVLRNLERNNIYVRSRSESESGEMNPNYGRIYTDETLKKMSDSHKGEKSYRFGKHLSEKERHEISVRMTGKNNPMYGRNGSLNPNWKGGISSLPYCTKFSDPFKNQVRKKFDNTCFICGKIPEDRNCDVHHIDYNKNSICKGKAWAFVPLCNSCHTKTNFDRWYWFSLLINYWLENESIHFKSFIMN